MALPVEVVREIRAEIVRRGLKQRDVALEAGLSPDRLTRVLTRLRPPRAGELQLVAEAVERLAPRDRRHA